LHTILICPFLGMLWNLDNAITSKNVHSSLWSKYFQSYDELVKILTHYLKISKKESLALISLTILCKVDGGLKKI
jgi:hypothetical protein